MTEMRGNSRSLNRPVLWVELVGVCFPSVLVEEAIPDSRSINYKNDFMCDRFVEMTETLLVNPSGESIKKKVSL